MTFFVTSFLFSQNEKTVKENIPDNLQGSWVIEMPGEGQVPSQIFRWKFSKIETNNGECEFHWLFKRQEDPDFITVAVAIYDFYIDESKIHGKQRCRGKG